MSEHIEADFIVPMEFSEMRLDQAVAQLMPEHSRSRIQGWIKSGELKVNERTCRPKDKVIVGTSSTSMWMCPHWISGSRKRSP